LGIGSFGGGADIAQYEHLPIFRTAFQLTVYLEEAVGVGVAMSVLAHLERGKVSGATRDGDVVTGITMQDASSHVDKAKTYDTVGYVMYGLGGAAVVTGVVLALTQPKADAREAAASAGASPVPGGVAFSIAGRF